MGLVFSRVRYVSENKTVNLNGFGWVCFFLNLATNSWDNLRLSTLSGEGVLNSVEG